MAFSFLKQMFRFKRDARLLTPREFKRVMDRPTLRASSQGFVLLASENAGDFARIGFVLPRRRVRLAVARNRIKRIIRESFRHRQANLSGLDIVVMARDGLSTIENPALRTAVDRQFDYLSGKWQNLRTPPDIPAPA